MPHRKIIKVNMIGNKLPKDPQHENFHPDHKTELCSLYQDLRCFDNLNCKEYEAKYKHYIRTKSKYTNATF